MSRRLRTAVHVLVVGAVLASVLVIAPSAASAQAADTSDSDAADQPLSAVDEPVRALGVIGAFRTPLRPNGLAIAGGAVLNGTLEDLPAPIRLVVSGIPAGAKIEDFSSSAGALAEVDWSCLPVDASTICTLVDVDDRETPAALPAESLAPWEMTIRAGSNALTEPTSVTVRAEAGNGSAAEPLAMELLPAAADDLPVLVDLDVPAEIVADEDAASVVEVVNVGAEAIDAGALTVGGIVPPGAADVRTTSPGWRCTTATGSVLCRLRRVLEPGAGAEALVVEYRSPKLDAAPDVAATDETDAQGPDDGAGGPATRQLAWTTTVTVTDADGSVTSEIDEDTLVVPGPPPQLAVTAVVRDSLVVVPPATAVIGIDVMALDLDRDDAAPVVTLDLPDGLTPAPDVAIDGWSCGPGDAGRFRCQAEGSGVFEDTDTDALQATLDVVVDVAADAAPGARTIEVEASIAGEAPQTLADNTTSVDLVVSEREVAVLDPVLYVDDGDGLRPSVDGAPLDLSAGSSFGIGAKNLGSAPFEASGTWSIDLTLPPGVVVATESAGCRVEAIGSSPFVVGSRLRCEGTASDDIVPDAGIDPVEVRVEAIDSGDAAHSLPLRFAAVDPAVPAGDVHRVDLDVAAVVTSRTPTLGIDATPVRLAPLAETSLRVAVENPGAGDADGWRVLLSMPADSGIAWGELGDAEIDSADEGSLECAPFVPVATGLFDGLGSAALAECRAGSSIAAGGRTELRLPLVVGDDAVRTELTATVIADGVPIPATAPALVPVLVDVAPSAVAEAVFDRLDPGMELGVLDGRSSEGADTYVWRQVAGPDAEEPAVVVRWDDGTAGGEQRSRVAWFVVPSVAVETELWFELTVAAGEQADADVVSVTVEPDPGLDVVPVGSAADPTALAAAADPDNDRGPEAADGGAEGDGSAGGDSEPPPDAATGRSVGVVGFPVSVAQLDDTITWTGPPGGSDWVRVPTDWTAYNGGEGAFYLYPLAPFLQRSVPAGTEISLGSFQPRFSRPNGAGGTVTAEAAISAVEITPWCLTIPAQPCTSTPIVAGPSPYDNGAVWTVPADAADQPDQYLLITWTFADPAAPATVLATGWTMIPVTAAVPMRSTSELPSTGVPANELGESITIDAGGWAPAPSSYHFTIRRCATPATPFDNCSPVDDRTTGDRSITYQPVAADAGTTIKVRIQAGNAAGRSLDSPQGRYVLSFAPFDDAVVEVSPSTIIAPIAGTPTTVVDGSHAPASATRTATTWQVCTAAAAGCSTASTGSTYTPVLADVGRYLRATVTMTAPGGSTDFTTASRLVTGTAPVNSAPPTISVSQQQGAFRVATSSGSWTGVALAETTIALRSCPTAGTDPASCPIVGTPQVLGVALPTGADWLLDDAAVVGRHLRAQVTVTNWAGESYEMAATATGDAEQVPLPDPVVDPGAPPLVSGIARVGSELTVDAGGWFWADASATGAPQAVGVAWSRCDDVAATNCVPIVGATAATYVPTTADLGAHLRATVTVTNSWGRTASVTTDTTAAVTSYTLVADVAPAITIPDGVSAPRVGQVVSVTPATWANPDTDPIATRTYQWSRCAPTCAPIPGETGTTYTVTVDDLGATLQVVETATTDAAVAAASTSAATQTVATNLPVIADPAALLLAGTAQVGQTLTLHPGAWSSWDGGAVTLTNHWHTCADPGTPLATDVATLEMTEAMVGSTICATVVATSSHGSAAPATTAPTDEVVRRDAPLITGVPVDPVVVATDAPVAITLSGVGFAPLEFSWTQAATGAPTLDPSAFSGGTVTFTSPSSGTGTFSFVVELSQGDGQTTTAYLDVEYREGLVVGFVEPDGVVVPGGEAATVTATATGVGPFTYSWSQTGGAPVTLDPSGATVAFTPPAVGDGTLELSVEVTDAFGVTMTAPITVTYEQPVAIDVGAETIDVAGDVDVTVTANASGLGGLEYTWTQVDESDQGRPFVPVTLAVEGSNVALRTPATGAGTITLQVEVRSLGNGRTAVRTIRINYAQPAAIVIEGVDGVTGEIVTLGGAPLTIRSVPAGIGPFGFSWTQISGEPVLGAETVVDRRALTITPPATGDGILVFRVDLATANGASSATVTVRYRQPAIIVGVTPDAPLEVGRSTPVELAADATALDATGVWTQVAGPSVLPDGGVVGTTATITTPADGNGTLVFRFTVTGSNGETASRDVTVTYTAETAPAGLCTVIGAIRAPGSVVSLGDSVTFRAGTGTIRPGGCDGDLEASFARAELVIDGVFSLTDATGTIDADGIRLVSGRMTVADAAMGGLRLRLVGDGLSIDFGGNDFAVVGSVEAEGLAGIAPPNGWTATTRIDFAAGRRQQIAVTATATAPGASAPGLVLRGAYRLGGAFDLEARVSGLLRLGGGDIALAGSVRRESRDAPVDVSIGATLENPVRLGDGVELTAATFAYESGAVSGAATVTVGDLVLDGAFRASARDRWSIDVSARGVGNVTLAPGVTLGRVAITGSVSRNGADLDASLALAVGRWNVTDGLELDDVSFSLDVACRGGDCTKSLSVSALASIVVGERRTSGRLEGAIDQATGSMSLTAELANIDLVPGLTFSSLQLHLESSPNSSPQVYISAEGLVSGAPFVARIEVDDAGWWFSTELDALRLVPGAPTLRDVVLRYSSSDRVLPEAAGGISLEGNTLTAAASMTMPTWVGDLTGGSRPVLDVSGTIDLTARRFTLDAVLGDLGGASLFDVGGVRVAADSIGLLISNAGGPVTFRLRGDVTLRIPGIAGGSATNVPLTIEGGPSGDGRSFDAALSLRDGARWDDAFGLDGLDISGLSVALQTGLGSGGGRLGIAGTATLPGGVADPLGVGADTEITLAASLGTGAPCFAFEIGDGTRQAIDLLDAGVLTADHASFVVAPAGCRIGTYTYPPGMSFGFDGEVFDAPVFVEVALDPTRATLEADVAIGRIGISGLSLDAVTVSAFVSPSAQELSFSGAATLLGATATVDGTFERSARGLDVALRGTFSGVDLDGFEIGEIEASIESSNGMRDLAIAASGSLDILGTDIEADLELEMVNGRLDYARGSGLLDSELGDLELDADVEFEFVRGRFPDIAFEGRLAAGGFEMAEVQGRVNRRGASLLASLDLDPVFTARLGGWIAYSSGGDGGDDSAGDSSTNVSVLSVPADARPGDFELFADNVRIGLGGFDLQGRVLVGARGGLPRASVAAQLRLGLGRDFGATVDLRGDLEPDGSLQLEGAGVAIVAGHRLSDAQFTAFSNPAAGEAGVSIDARVGIGESEIRVGGAFERRAQHGTLFRIFGAATLEVGDFEFADTRLLLVRDVAPTGSGSTAALRQLAADGPVAGAPLVANRCATVSCEVRTGLIGAADFEAPAVGRVDVTMAISTDGIAFDGEARLRGLLGDVLGRPAVAVSVRVGSDGRADLGLRASVKDAFGIPVSFFFEGTISSSGLLTAKIRASASLTAKVSLAAVEFRAIADATFSLDLRIDLNRASSIDASAALAASATIQAKFWEPFSYGSWQTVLSLGIAGSTNPLRLRVSLNLFGFDVTFRIA